MHDLQTVTKTRKQMPTGNECAMRQRWILRAWKAPIIRSTVQIKASWMRFQGEAEIYGQTRVANKYLQLRSGTSNYHAGWKTYGQHCPLNNNRPIFPHPSTVVCTGMDVYLCCRADRARPNFLSHPRHDCLCLANTTGRPQGARVCVCVCECIYRLCVTCADWCRRICLPWSRNHFASWNSSIKWQARE